MRTYKTAQVAKIVGIHPNTVRLYEELALIPKPERAANGYRIFTERHIEHITLARIAFQVEILQNGLRSIIIDMVKTAASGDFDAALTLSDTYLSLLQAEEENANEAIQITKQLLSGNLDTVTVALNRADAAKHLNISTDTLRNWELNGLLTVKRKANGYRIYTEVEIKRLKIIRSLRCANYSLQAILRMLTAISANPNANVLQALDTPEHDDDIISVCDKLLTSLRTAKHNVCIMQKMLHEMKKKYETLH